MGSQVTGSFVPLVLNGLHNGQRTLSKSTSVDNYQLKLPLGTARLDVSLTGSSFTSLMWQTSHAGLNS
jgi:hypothetical protein